MKIKIILLIAFFLTSCGVKGRPQPPQKAPPIGRGEPTYSQSTSEDFKDK